MASKIKACVFISGKGSNLKSLIKSSRNYNFPIKIELIISNNIKAKGLEIAKRNSIPYKFFSSNNQKKFEKNSLFEIKKRKTQKGKPRFVEPKTRKLEKHVHCSGERLKKNNIF